MHFGLAAGIAIKETPTLWARRGVFRTRGTESNSPIAYGYEEKLGAYFNTAPVLVDARHGDGHIVMFSFNPFWRGETVGSYA